MLIKDVVEIPFFHRKHENRIIIENGGNVDKAPYYQEKKEQMMKNDC